MITQRMKLPSKSRTQEREGVRCRRVKKMGRGWGGIYRTSGSGGHCHIGEWPPGHHHPPSQLTCTFLGPKTASCDLWRRTVPLLASNSNSISVGSKRVVLEVSQSKIPKIQVGYTCSHRTVIMLLHPHVKLLPFAATIPFSYLSLLPTVNLLKHQILGCCGCKLNEAVGLTHFAFHTSSCGSWALSRLLRPMDFKWRKFSCERNLIQVLTTHWHKQKKVEGCSTWDLGPGTWDCQLLPCSWRRAHSHLIPIIFFFSIPSRFKWVVNGHSGKS